jgi:hypothetical protein
LSPAFIASLSALLMSSRSTLTSLNFIYVDATRVRAHQR